MSEITQLERLLLPGSLKVVFQPVFQVLQHGVKVIELEGLIRGPRGTHVESPDVLFEYVRRKGKESKLDRACTTAILEAAGQLNTNLRIGINVTAATLGNDLEFPSFVRSEAERYRIATSRITIELVEHAPFWDGGIFLQALEALRNMGIRIALDDIGMGQSNYRWSKQDLREDLPKRFDAILHKCGCSRSGITRALIRTFVEEVEQRGLPLFAGAAKKVADIVIKKAQAKHKKLHRK